MSSRYDTEALAREREKHARKCVELADARQRIAELENENAAHRAGSQALYRRISELEAQLNSMSVYHEGTAAQIEELKQRNRKMMAYLEENHPVAAASFLSAWDSYWQQEAPDEQ